MRKLSILIAFAAMILASEAASQSALLDSAYAVNSDKLVGRFFEQWHNEISPVADTEYQQMNDTLRNVYDVFKVFFTPFELKKYSTYDIHAPSLKGAKYIVLPNEIPFRIVKTLDEDTIFIKNMTGMNKGDTINTYEQYHAFKKSKDNGHPGTWHVFQFIDTADVIIKDTIHNFRPIVKIAGLKNLYLSKYYEKSLLSHLGRGGVTILGEKAKDELLRKYIRVANAWSWRLLTLPAGWLVSFDKDMQTAMIDYGLMSEVGCAYFVKRNGRWVFSYAYICLSH